MRRKRINMRPVRRLIHWPRKDDNGFSCWRQEAKLKLYSLKEDIRDYQKDKR